MSERPSTPPNPQDFAARNGWDREFLVYHDFDLPTYVGPTTFANLPWVTDPAELRARKVDVAIVGAPFDDMVTHRPGARFGPRAIREAQYSSGSLNSLQLRVEPFELLTVVDAGDANIVPAYWQRAHAMIYRKVREVAGTGAIPIVLGGDHSITWPSATAVAEIRRPGSIGIVHFDAHADTAPDAWGQIASHGSPMRHLIESGAVDGRNFVQVGLRGYWPPVDVLDWMREHGLRCHFMTEIEERGAEAVVADAIAEALDGPGFDLPLDRHRCRGPGPGPRYGDARARRPPVARDPARGAADRRGGRPGRHGHRRGRAAVRLGRVDIDDREPARPRGDLRACRQAPVGGTGPLGGIGAGHPFLDNPGPIAFAHRGGTEGHPDNTMAAFSSAVDLGYRYLETDVHATADGVLVAFHDDRLDGLTDRRGSIGELAWSDVREAKVAGIEPIVAFADLLSTFPAARINVDPKHDAAVPALVRIMRDPAVAERLCIGSFSDRRVAEIRDTLGSAACTALAPWEVAALRVGAWGLRPFLERLRNRPGRCVQVSTRGKGGLPLVDPGMLAAAHELRLPVHVWTINDAEEMARLLDLGVDGIFSDRPTLLRSVLRARHEWTDGGAVRAVDARPGA